MQLRSILSDILKISFRPKEFFAEITDAASENVGTKTVMTLGGKPIYKLYTSFDVDGEKIDFEKEVKFIVEAYEGFEDMTDESLSPEESGASLRDISLYIDDTTVVPAILADLINAAGEDWIAGNEFHSIPCPDLGEGTHDIIISLLKCLSDSTSETMKEDLKSIINILAIVAENKNDDGSSMEISALLSNKALVSKISVEVLDNERLAPMIKHLMVSNVSGPAPTITIELPKEDDPQYNEFIDKVVTGYSDGIQAENTEKALENVSQSVSDTFEEHGIEVDEGVETIVAAALISEFGDGKEMTSEALKQFINENLSQETIDQYIK